MSANSVTQTEYKRDYMPGYTGHVPSKALRFGMTAGRLKQEILEDKGLIHKYYARLDAQATGQGLSYFS